MKSDFRLPLQNNTMNTDNSKLTAWEKMQLDMIDDDLDEDLFHRCVAVIGCGSIVTHDIPPRTRSRQSLPHYSPHHRGGQSGIREVIYNYIAPERVRRLRRRDGKRNSP